MKHQLMTLAFLAISRNVHGGCYTNPPGSLICEGLHDGDLPLKGHAGLYPSVIIDNNNFTTIPANSFPGIRTQGKFQITVNQYLETIESGFLNGIEHEVEDLFLAGNYILKNIPFEDMAKFTNLKYFSVISCGIEVFPSNTPWPNTLQTMSYMGNMELRTIEPYAFSEAEGIELIDLRGSGNNLTVKSNGFHSKSNMNKTLEIAGNPFEIKYESNAFGNVEGGKLWNHMSVPSGSFQENVFRLLLKSHFDKGHQSLLGGNSNFIPDCLTCEVAWVYKDAHKFGLDAYRNLVGRDNLRCLNSNSNGLIFGSILESQSPELIAFMDSCPYNEMPWPGPNVCEAITDANQDITADPNNCQCYFLCADQQIHGHECCPNGLVFNPLILNCDWPFNVPTCNVK